MTVKKKNGKGKKKASKECKWSTTEPPFASGVDKRATVKLAAKICTTIDMKQIRHSLNKIEHNIQKLKFITSQFWSVWCASNSRMCTAAEENQQANALIPSDRRETLTHNECWILPAGLKNSVYGMANGAASGVAVEN